jgi:hypothetical protein
MTAIRYGNFIAPATLRATLSRVSTYPYIYILYSTLRYELWKLECCEPAIHAVPGYCMRSRPLALLTNRIVH